MFDGDWREKIRYMLWTNGQRQARQALAATSRAATESLASAMVWGEARHAGRPATRRNPRDRPGSGSHQEPGPRTDRLSSRSPPGRRLDVLSRQLLEARATDADDCEFARDEERVNADQKRHNGD